MSWRTVGHLRPKPHRAAMAAACVRLRAPSLFSSCFVRRRAWRSDRPIASAISVGEAPSARRSRRSLSRRESSRLGGGSFGQRASAVATSDGRALRPIAAARRMRLTTTTGCPVARTPRAPTSRQRWYVHVLPSLRSAATTAASGARAVSRSIRSSRRPVPASTTKSPRGWSSTQATTSSTRETVTPDRCAAALTRAPMVGSAEASRPTVEERGKRGRKGEPFGARRSCAVCVGLRHRVASLGSIEV